MTNRKNIDVNPFNSLGAIAVMVVGFILLWYLVKGFFLIQTFVAPVLIGITALINYKIVLGYVKMLANLLRRNVATGIIAIILTFVFPLIVALFLFGKAMLVRKVDKMTKEFKAQQEGEFVEYDEVEEEPPTLIELPPRPRQERRNEYEELFDDDKEI